jgi:hypothetical protein
VTRPELNTNRSCLQDIDIHIDASKNEISAIAIALEHISKGKWTSVIRGDQKGLYETYKLYHKTDRDEFLVDLHYIELVRDPAPFIL